MKPVIVFFILLTIVPTLSAQADAHAALNAFLSTNFFFEFDQAREKAEISVRDFKRTQNNYSEEEIQNLADAYNEAADYFNLALGNIKRDMLIKDKRRYMSEYPNDYSKQVERDLIKAKDFYANTYQRKLRNLTGDAEAGTPLIALIPQVIDYVQIAFGLFKQIQEKVRQFNEEMINQYMLEPYRFKSWGEIS